MVGNDPSLTAMLRAHARGEMGAFDGLPHWLYEDLRRLARRWLRGRPPQTLDSRALVHETFLKLTRRLGSSWRDSGHFRAAFGQAMRHVLVDAARHRLSARRGGDRVETTLGEDVLADDRQAEDLLSVDHALDSLRCFDQRLARVVECRFFAGMTEEETAESLGISARTVHRDWLRARGWLRVRLDAFRPSTGGVGS